MATFFPAAGQAQKITTHFKSKVFSFGYVVVADNKLTLFQISEPLQSTSSATTTNPAPFGTDFNGHPVNDPIPDTMIDPATGQVVSAPANGTPVLLDKWSILKPDLRSEASITIAAPERAMTGSEIVYRMHVSNTSQYALNGTQVRFYLPKGSTFAGTPGDTVTLSGDEVIVTLGRLEPGTSRDLSIATMATGASHKLETFATLTSATSRPVRSKDAVTSFER